MQAPPQSPHSALRYLDPLYNLARWLTQDDALAQAVVQRACLEAFGRLDAAPEADIRIRLMAIVCLACHSTFQHAKSGGGVELADSPTRVGTDDRHRTNDALHRLPIELREVIVLREMEDLSYGAISSITGVPVGVVMSRLGLARARLARCLERDEA